MSDTTTRVLRLRYRATCALCACDLEPGTQARWDRARKSATCLACVEAAPQTEAPTPTYATPAAASVTVATAGGSARAEAARRREKQQARLEAEREARPVLGRMRQGLFPEADAGAMWDKGAVGEEKLAEAMQPLVEAGTILALHDRRIPRSTANIDHLAVAANGVWVIDAKRYTGRVAKDVRGGFLESRTVVTVGGRDRTKLVDGVEKQMGVVRNVLTASGHELPVHGALCFMDAEWGLFRLRPFTVKGVLITWAKALRQRLSESGDVDPERRQQVLEALADALPPAS